MLDHIVPLAEDGAVPHSKRPKRQTSRGNFWTSTLICTIKVVDEHLGFRYLDIIVSFVTIQWSLFKT